MNKKNLSLTAVNILLSLLSTQKTLNAVGDGGGKCEEERFGKSNFSRLVVIQVLPGILSWPGSLQTSYRVGVKQYKDEREIYEDTDKHTYLCDGCWCDTWNKSSSVI